MAADVDDVGGALALADLVEGVTTGLLRGAALLTRGERAVAGRIAGLPGPAGTLYARLLSRKPAVFAEDGLEASYGDVGSAIEVLVASNLADRLVPWDERADASTADALRDGCRALGLPSSGLRETLIARLRGRTAWSERRWLRVRHRGLVGRLWRFALLSRHADGSRQAVLERIGVRRWPAYRLSDPPGATAALWFSGREALLWWETLDPATLTLDGALDALALAQPLVRGLDLRRDLRERVLGLAQAEERAGQQLTAVTAYGRLASLGMLGAEGEVRRALAREAVGQIGAAISGLEAALPGFRGHDRLAMKRTLRRLSRRVGKGTPPDPPLRPPVLRRLSFDHADPTDLRPRYRVGEQALHVEQAAIARLGEHGRRAIHAEGSLWTTLFALLFAEAYFLPLPGALPVPRLSGPLDIGTPGFAAARSAMVEAILADVAAGRAPERVEAADARWRGTALSGASWSFTPEDLRSIAGMSPPSLTAILRRFCVEGWNAARGLPDLAVLDGPEVALSRSFPSRLPSGVVLAECKGPTDTVRDAQAWWHHLLTEAGVRVELWEIKAVD